MGVILIHFNFTGVILCLKTCMTNYSHHFCCHCCIIYLLFHQGYTLPVDCKVGDWKRWGECSATCGGGTKTSERDVIAEPENGGASCPALEETMACNTEGCPGSFLILLFDFHHLYLQLTARLAIGSGGENAAQLATVEPRREDEMSSKNQRTEVLRVQL